MPSGVIFHFITTALRMGPLSGYLNEAWGSWAPRSLHSLWTPATGPWGGRPPVLTAFSVPSSTTILLAKTFPESHKGASCKVNLKARSAPESFLHGSIAPLRQERTGALVVTQAHGGRYGAAFRKNLFTEHPHGTTLMRVDDTWYRGLVVAYGPDGGVYISDWTDTGECHKYEVADKTNGRIYKIVNGTPKPWQGDISRQSDAELVDLQSNRNEWLVRHARRVLQERQAAGKLAPETRGRLLEQLATVVSTTHKLRLMWTLHAVGGLNDAELMKLLLRISTNRCRPGRSGWRWKIGRPHRRCSTAWGFWPGAARPGSAWSWRRPCSRSPIADRWELVDALAQHPTDANDANIPLMLWYAVEPMVPADTQRHYDWHWPAGFRSSASTSLAGWLKMQPDSTRSSSLWRPPPIPKSARR